MKVFLTNFAWWWKYRDPEPDPYLVITDPGGPKTDGSYGFGSGSGSPTLLAAFPLKRKLLYVMPKVVSHHNVSKRGWDLFVSGAVGWAVDPWCPPAGAEFIKRKRKSLQMQNVSQQRMCLKEAETFLWVERWVERRTHDVPRLERDSAPPPLLIAARGQGQRQRRRLLNGGDD